MKMNVTRWQPDTCECVIEYEWEHNSDPATRVHTPINIIPCSAHRPLSLVGHTILTPKALNDIFKIVLEENKRKNLLLAEKEK